MLKRSHEHFHVQILQTRQTPSLPIHKSTKAQCNKVLLHALVHSKVLDKLTLCYRIFIWHLKAAGCYTFTRQLIQIFTTAWVSSTRPQQEAEHG